MRSYVVRKNIADLGNTVKTLFDLHKFINKTMNKVKSSYIFGLTNNSLLHI